MIEELFACWEPPPRYSGRKRTDSSAVPRQVLERASEVVVLDPARSDKASSKDKGCVCQPLKANAPETFPCFHAVLPLTLGAGDVPAGPGSPLPDEVGEAGESSEELIEAESENAGTVEANEVLEEGCA